MKKLVIESLNELRNFEKRKDPLSSLGIGKRKLIEDWLRPFRMQIHNYEIDDNFNININCSVYLSMLGIEKFPEYIQFGKIDGDFDVYGNKLVSLRGCPCIVNGFFDCDKNNLITLEGCPSIVSECFSCSNNAKKFTVDDIKKYCKKFKSCAV